jgi:hypothetical protein
VPDSKRVLLVANEAVEGEALGQAVLEQLGEQREVFVVAPALVDSALKHHFGDVDDAIPAAEERLRRSLRWLRDHGVEARGEVGDSDPLIAASDEVNKFGPHRIVVIAHRAEEATHAETDLEERAERDLDQPLTELLVAGNGGEARVVDVITTEPGAGRAKGRRASFNLPPMTPRDLIGIAVAVVGTVALGILASAHAGADSSPNLEEGRLEGASEPALILLALAMALINLAHVVGLVFFQSVRYTGAWEKLFARLSLYGTPVAVAVAAAVVAIA